MAESRQAAGKGKEAAAPTEERGPTMRMVLKRERVLVTPSDVTTEQLIAAHKAMGGKGAPQETEAWVVVGEFEGVSKERAIEAYAGKPGTPDAKPGAFKAPTVAAFAGGARYVAPPKPLVEREAID